MLKWLNMQPEKRKKICFVVTKGVWGGAQKYVYTLATSLPKEEYDVSVITGKGNALKEKLDGKGVRVYTLRNLERDISIVAEIKSFIELFKIIKKESPDVLHLNSPKAGGLGSVIGRILFIRKIIFTVHGWTFNEDRGVIEKALITFFSWITILLCHKTIVISSQEEEQALAMPFVNKERITLIRNGVEKINFKEKSVVRNDFLSLVRKSDASDILLFGTIAELHKNKGLEYAIEAVSKIKTSFVFFIIGDGEERNNLENMIKKYNLENRVFLLGFLDNANQYLKAFDIFILTSVKEGLPYTILEAGSAGLPVVASNVGGIPDIIENGISGILVTKSRAGEITRALEFLLQNPDKQKSYGENLKAKVEKDFSLDQMIEKTKKLYYNK